MTSYAVSINPDLDNEKKNLGQTRKPASTHYMYTSLSNWSHWNDLIS